MWREGWCCWALSWGHLIWAGLLELLNWLDFWLCDGWVLGLLLFRLLFIGWLD